MWLSGTSSLIVFVWLRIIANAAPTTPTSTPSPTPSSLDVTKWVHLNYGDLGLCTLLRRAHSLLKPGGRLVLAAQRWQTYGRSARLTAPLRTALPTLAMRPRDLPDYLLTRIRFSRALPPQPVRVGRAGGGRHVCHELTVYEK